jgi:hypothetical protein
VWGCQVWFFAGYGYRGESRILGATMYRGGVKDFSLILSHLSSLVKRNL